jgi:sugar O-acyltransferase (sialic acid O-acetyltransferase NeuD family)
MNILVYGSGGQGKVVADILLAGGRQVCGFLDDNQLSHGSTVVGIPVIGGADCLRKELTKGKVAVALGVGSNHARQLVSDRCKALGAEIISAIHPAASISSSGRIGAGTVVMAGAVVNPSAEIGVGVIVNSGAIIEHDVIVGDYAHVSPNSTMGGTSRLGAFSHLGLGAVVLPGIVIGRFSVIGAGAVVTRAMPDHVVAVGVPARIRRAQS